MKVTFEGLRQQVALFAAAMRRMGVRKGDRVVGECLGRLLCFGDETKAEGVVGGWDNFGTRWGSRHYTQLLEKFKGLYYGHVLCPKGLEFI